MVTLITLFSGVFVRNVKNLLKPTQRSLIIKSNAIVAISFVLSADRIGVKLIKDVASMWIHLSKTMFFAGKYFGI